MISHLKYDKAKNSYKYRRRVPEHLQPMLGKKEFSKILGRTEPEAMKNYNAVHQHYEKMLQFTPTQLSGSDTKEIKEQIIAQFIELEADLYSSGKSDDEKFAREERADQLLRKYPAQVETGYPDRNDLTAQDKAMITALMEGVSAIKSKLTISAAYAFYLEEKQEPN
ncbi:MAG: hypothetical protein ACI82J_002105, partial [Sulfitobacter litoralis]